VDPAFQLPKLVFDFFDGFFVGFLSGQFEQDLAFFDLGFQRVEAFELIGDPSAFFQDLSGGFGIVPEVGFGNLLFDFLETVFLGRQVKDNLGAVRVSGPDLRYPV